MFLQQDCAFCSCARLASYVHVGKGHQWHMSKLHNVADARCVWDLVGIELHDLRACRYSKFYNGIFFHIIKGSPQNEVVVNKDQLTIHVVAPAEKKHHSKWLIVCQFYFRPSSRLVHTYLKH